MATPVWQGDAIAVAQVQTATPVNVGTADVFTLTCGGFSVSYTALTGDAVSDVVTGLTTAWNASTDAPLTEITAADSSTHVTLTHDTAGVEFVVTGDTTDGDASDDQDLTIAESTAVVGPNVWCAANFDTGILPASSDTVILENSAVDILYGLDQSAVTLTKLVVRASFTGSVGLPRTASAAAHDAGTAAYVEYRETYLKIGATNVEYGKGLGTGSPRFKLDNSSIQTTLDVYSTGSSSDNTIGALVWKGTHAANVVSVNRGNVSICHYSGDVATIATLNIGYVTSPASDSTVRFGTATATLTTINQSGGTLVYQNNVTTHTQTAGKSTIGGTATATTLNLDAGTCYYQSSGTLTTANVGGRGSLDFRQDMRARTVTNCNVYEGFALRDPSKTVAWTNGIDCVRCAPTSGTLDIGEHQTLTPSAI